MATFSKVLLSGSTNGKAVKVAATATAGTTIHTAHATALDEIWLYAVNSSASSVKLTLEWGEATAPDGNIELTVTAESGLVLVCAGLLLTSSLVVKAFAGTANVILLHGYVNRITPQVFVPRPHAPRTRVSTYLSDWMPINIPSFEAFLYFTANGSTSVNKMSSYSETVTTTATALSTTTNSIGTFADSGVAGYVPLGSSAVMNKFSFPSDTRSSTGALSSQSRAMACASNNAVAGYILGGADPIGTIIQKVAYPNDSISTIGATLSNALHHNSAFTNSGTAGYSAGGTVDGNIRYLVVDKLAFPAETKTSLGTGLTAAIWYGGGFANSGVAGYIAGGQTSVPLNYIDRFAFPADTKTTLAATLATARRQMACTGTYSSKSKCYIAGGADSGGTISSIISLDSAETTSVISSTLTAGRLDGSGFADCGVF